MLTVKVASTIMAIVCFSVALLNFVTYLKYDTTITQIVGSRFLVIGEDLLQTVSKGLDLGLSLKELQTTQAVIESVKKNDSQILSISVFSLEKDNSGKILYNTRHAGIGGTAPTYWIDTLKAHIHNTHWLLDEDDVGSVGVTLFNTFKEPIGGIVVRYDQRQLDEKSLSFAKNLFMNSLIAMGLGFVCVLLVSHLIFRTLGDSFSRMKDALEDLMKEKSMNLTTTKPFHFAPANEVEYEFQRMLDATKVTWKDMTELDQWMDKESAHES
jgi:hypothetical protein